MGAHDSHFKSQTHSLSLRRKMQFVFFSSISHPAHVRTQPLLLHLRFQLPPPHTHLHVSTVRRTISGAPKLIPLLLIRGRYCSVCLPFVKCTYRGNREWQDKVKDITRLMCPRATDAERYIRSNILFNLRQKKNSQRGGCWGKKLTTLVHCWKIFSFSWAEPVIMHPLAWCLSHGLCEQLYLASWSILIYFCFGVSPASQVASSALTVCQWVSKIKKINVFFHVKVEYILA